jgi:anti-anti-sigma factor
VGACTAVLVLSKLLSTRPIRPIERVDAALSVRFEGGEDAPLRAVLAGEIDFASSSSMQARIASALERHRAKALILDLSEVHFMDSSGLRAIVQIQRELSESDGGMVLFDPTAQVRRILALTGLDQHLQVADGVDEAERLLGMGADEGARGG